MRPPRVPRAHVERRKEGEEGGLIGIPSPHCPTRPHTPHPSAGPHLVVTLPLYMPPSTPCAYALACRLTCPRPLCLFCSVRSVNSTYFDQRLDTNHDGVLTIDELAATIAELDADDADSETAGSIAKRADVRLLLRTADANGDGQVTGDECGERFASRDDSERDSSAVRLEGIRKRLECGRDVHVCAHATPCVSSLALLSSFTSHASFRRACPRASSPQAVPEQVRIYLGNAPTDMVIVWTTFGASSGAPVG